MTFDYFIAHMQASENITYNNPNGNPSVIWDVFGNARHTENEEQAFHIANEVEKEYDYVEYGIEVVFLPYPMSYYKAAAVGEYLQEILDISTGNTKWVEQSRMEIIADLTNKIIKIIPAVKKPEPAEDIRKEHGVVYKGDPEFRDVTLKAIDKKAREMDKPEDCICACGHRKFHHQDGQCISWCVCHCKGYTAAEE